jgi:hypothetical protein
VDPEPQAPHPHHEEGGSEVKQFEGKEVIGSKLIVTKAGDGLSDSLRIDPIAYPLGARVRVVIEGTIGKVNHVPVKSKGESLDVLVREHTLVTEVATIVKDSSRTVTALLEDAVELAANAREMDGQTSLGDLIPDHEGDEG